MSPKGGSDSRKIPRFKVSRATIECKRPGLFSFMRRPLRVFMHDISSTGMKLRSNEEIKRGDIIKGTVNIPDVDISMEFSGTVRWVRKMKPKKEGYAPGSEFGLRFDKVKEGELAKLEAIRKLLTSKRYRRAGGGRRN